MKTLRLFLLLLLAFPLLASGQSVELGGGYARFFQVTAASIASNTRRGGVDNGPGCDGF